MPEDVANRLDADAAGQEPHRKRVSKAVGVASEHR